jgi:hypothetical protein
MRLVCVQPPVRAAAIDGDRGVAAAERHWRRVDEILAPTGTRLLNLQRDMPLTDDYFADYSHVNARGAALCGDVVGRRVAQVLAAGQPTAAAATMMAKR